MVIMLLGDSITAGYGGMAGERRLNQPDGIHPNAAGVKVIAARMAPFVAAALEALS